MMIQGLDHESRATRSFKFFRVAALVYLVVCLLLSVLAFYQSKDSEGPALIIVLVTQPTSGLLWHRLGITPTNVVVVFAATVFFNAAVIASLDILVSVLLRRHDRGR
jgi:hypothetical protein